MRTLFTFLLLFAVTLLLQAQDKKLQKQSDPSGNNHLMLSGTKSSDLPEDDLSNSIKRLKGNIYNYNDSTRNYAKLGQDEINGRPDVYGDNDPEIDALTEGSYKNDSIVYLNAGQELRWVNIVRRTFLYDLNKNVTENLRQIPDSMGNWINDNRIVNNYDGNSKPVRSVLQTWVDSSGTWANVSLIDSSVYDPDGNQLEHYEAVWDTDTAKWDFTNANFKAYDTNNWIVSNTVKTFDQFSQVWTNNKRQIFFHYTDGRIDYINEDTWNGAAFDPLYRHYHYYDNQDYPDALTEIYTGQWNGSYYAGYQEVQFGYDTYGNRSSQTNSYYDGYSWQYTDRKFWNYDYQGRLEYQISQYFDYDYYNYVNDSRTTFYYDQGVGNTRAVEEEWDNYTGEWQFIRQNLLSYDQDGNVTERISQESEFNPVFTPDEKEVYIFDPYGKPVKAFFYEKSQVTGKWKLLMGVIVRYTDKGQLEDIISQAWSSYLNAWINMEKTVYHYSSKGDKTETLYYWWNADADQWEFQGRDVLVYNSLGQRVKKISSYWYEIDFQDESLVTYVYDEAGNMVVETEKNLQYDEGNKTDRIYDSANQVIIQVDYRWSEGNWLPENRTRFTYDSVGSMVQAEHEYYDEYGFYWYSDRIETYIYNTDTLLTEIRVEEEGEGLMLVGRTTLEYDSLKLLATVTVEDFDWNIWDLKLTSKEEHFWSEIENHCGLWVYVTDSVLPSCTGDNDGAITLMAYGGLAPYTFIFDGGDETSDTVFTGLSGDVYYRFTVKGSAGCILTDSIKLSDPAPISITIDKQNTYPGEATGNATAIVSGGSSPYSYLWTSGVETETAANLEAGLYFLTVTDSKGCTNHAVAAINDLGGPTIQVKSITDVSCFGAKDGAIDLEIVGMNPFTYTWSTGTQTQDIGNLAAGPYEVRVTDKNGLVSVKSINVRGPEKIVLKVATTNASCGISDGAATVTVSGGSGPFTYLWSTSGTGLTETNMAAGAYDFTVTDQDGCSFTRKVTISEVGAPYVVIDSVLNTGCGLMNGGIFLSVPMATDTITYMWSDGSELEDLTGIDPGSYYATITNIAGCKTVISADVYQEDPEINPICLVTVDSVTGKNLVAWDRVQTEGIATYNIYRESSQKDVFFLAGTIPATDETLFLDASADPGIRSFRYKLTAVDNCGNESEFSVRHKTMHLTLNLGLDNSVNLIWDLYEGFEFSTYDIWRFTSANGWELLESVSSNITSYTDFSPPFENLFYVVEVIHPTGCTPTELKAGTLNSSRSNRQSKLQEGNTSVAFGQVADGKVNVYPTLTTGLVNIEWKEMAGNHLTLEVNDLTGAVVFNRKFVHLAGTDFAGQIDLSFAAKGFYLLRMVSETGYSVVQVVIE